MKNSKFLLSFLFVLVSFCCFSQTQKLIYVRIQENLGGVYDSYIQITYADQTSKTIELKKLGLGGKGAEGNGKIIQSEISQLINQGYELISASTGSGDGSTTTTLFLTKKEK